MTLIFAGGPAPAFTTLTALFFEAIDRFDLPNAYHVKRDGRYHPISHRDVLSRARRISLGLGSIGVQRGDRVGIMSENRPEWSLADWACLCSGVTDVPIYPTLPADQIVHPLNDSGAVALFVSTPAQAAKAASVRGALRSVRRIISFCEPKPAGADLTLHELESAGAALDSEGAAAAWRATALSVRPDELATLIYTSGTTGLPKGVMLTHGNIASNCAAVRSTLPLRPGDVALSFLPFSHIFERTGDYFLFGAGVSIAFAEGMESIAANMGEVQPTMAMCVPRLFEKMYGRIVENATAAGGAKATIFRWARGVADRWSEVRLAGGTPSGMLAFQYRLADYLVFAKVRARLGGRLRFFVSGGAPLAPAINKFFYGAGITILEGYGLTETSPVISFNTFERLRIGSVGPILPGVEVRIAEDGEILTRGPHVMQGYFNRPDATAECITSDGWFHTGDIGVFEEGFLRITDRKKDIIVTAGGKNIAPQPIENRVKLNAFVSQAVMIGDKRKYPILLVVPNWEPLDAWASQQGMTWATHSELLANPAVVKKMESEVRSQLHGLASFESPKRIGLLEHDFSIERGELTPKLSVKRRVIDQTYKGTIDALYGDESD
jgi:long-chain acyl-CoA synthetase